MTKHEENLITELYKTYHDTLINRCRIKEYSAHDAKEFVDETFLRLTQNIHKLGDLHLKQLRAWLYTTLDNVILEHEYKNKKIAKESIDDLENKLPAEDVYEQTIDKDVYKDIMEEVYRRLSDEDIKFLMDYAQGKISYSDIAQESNTNYNTVKSQVYRRLLPIKKVVEEVLKEYDVELSYFKKEKKPRKIPK